MNTFTYLKKSCPICDGARSDCRQSQTTNLIHCRDDAANPSNYRHTGQDSLGFNLWAIDDGRSNRDWQEQRQQQREKRQQAEQQRRAGLLSIAERDRQFRAIARHAGLPITQHREALQRRGLSPGQIEAANSAGLLWSWQNQARVSGVTAALPGVEKDGRLRNFNGFAIGVPDPTGAILGAQIKPDDGKYIWLSSGSVGGNSIHLPNGEAPIGCYRPFACELSRAEINLTEGFLKPLIAAQKFGIVAIGASGANFCGSPKSLKNYLESLSTELGTRLIVLNPDSNSIANPSVLKQYQQAIDLAQQWGYSVEVRWWGQFTKADGDIDEIDSTVFATAKLITPEQFYAKAGSAKPVDRYQQETERIQRDLNSLRIEPTIAASALRYMPSGLVNLPNQPGILLIDAPMGAGKTSTVLRELVQNHRQRYPEALRALFVPRNALGLQAGKILGLPHHTQHQGFSIPKETTLCVESVWKLPPDRLPQQPPLLVFDEISQTLKQILYGDTCRDQQPLILRKLREMLRWVADQGGWIALSEDGLTNLELDFIQEASGLQVAEYLKFTQTAKPSRDYTLFDSPSATWAEIEARLQRGENLFIASDSAKWLRDTEQLAIDLGVSPKDVWILDGDSSEQPWAKEAADDPDKWTQAYKPRLFGCSPSLLCGVSNDDRSGHFAAVALHLVHLEPRAAKQIVDRLRTDKPRFGYVKPSASSNDNLCSGSRPDLILRDLYRNHAHIAKLTEFAQYAIDKAPTDADGNPLDLVGTMAAIDAGKDDPSSEYGFYLKYLARYQAREHYAKQALRQNLIAIWQQQGHQVTLLEKTASKAQSEKRNKIRAELDAKEAQAFAASDSQALTVAQAKEILGQLGSTPDDRRAAHKRLLEDKLPGCDLNQIDFVLKAIIKDDGKFLKSAELLWLAKNPEYARQLDRWNWLGAHTRAAKRGEMVWLPRLSVRSAQAKLLHECPLQPFIEGEIKQWDNNTQAAIAVKEWCVLHRHQFRRYLRLQISEAQTPVQVLNKLLRHFGYEVKGVGWKGSRAERTRQYTVQNLEDVDREAILNALTERFLKRCQDKGEAAVIATRNHDIANTSCDHEPSKSSERLTPEPLSETRLQLDLSPVIESNSSASTWQPTIGQRVLVWRWNDWTAGIVTEWPGAKPRWLVRLDCSGMVVNVWQIEDMALLDEPAEAAAS